MHVLSLSRFVLHSLAISHLPGHSANDHRPLPLPLTLPFGIVLLLIFVANSSCTTATHTSMHASSCIQVMTIRVYICVRTELYSAWVHIRYTFENHKQYQQKCFYFWSDIRNTHTHTHKWSTRSRFDFQLFSPIEQSNYGWAFAIYWCVRKI